MEMSEAIIKRRGIKKYTTEPLASNAVEKLKAAINEYNQHSGLNIRLCLNDPRPFASVKTIGFKNVHNYLAFIGNKSDKQLAEKCGYFGEKLILLAKSLGIDSRWVAATYKKSAVENVLENEELVLVATLGYGAEEKAPHKSKPLEKLYRNLTDERIPEWFINGVSAAQAAPTALNQQAFCFELLSNKTVRLQMGKGAYTTVDEGILRCHFEIGANSEAWQWA